MHLLPNLFFFLITIKINMALVAVVKLCNIVGTAIPLIGMMCTGLRVFLEPYKIFCYQVGCDFKHCEKYLYKYIYEYTVQVFKHKCCFECNLACKAFFLLLG